MERKPIPVISPLKFYWHANEILKDPLPFHQRNFKKLGDVFQIKTGTNKKPYFSRDPELLHYVLQKNYKNYHKSPIQSRDIAKYVGHGLLTSNGEHWRKQRRLVQPAFHKSKLKNLLKKVQDAIETELKRIETGASVNVFPIFNDLAFQTVVKALFSNAVENADIKRLQDITESVQKMVIKELRQPYKKWWFRLNGNIKHHLAQSEEARQILQKLIEKRQKSNERKDDLLDMLLEARYDDGAPMSDAQLIDEILILFTAGHETTSNALTFTCELLAQNPSTQEKVKAEVDREKTKDDDLMALIQNCPFTRHCIEESLRLYPPAYFIDRIALEADDFKGFHFPKGASLLFSVHEIHRQKKYWDFPEEFKPERFESQNHSDHYFPFGAGPRKCIGSNFAMYEMVLTIVDLLSTYKIIPTKSSIEINPLITLKPKNAVLEFAKW